MKKLIYGVGINDVDSPTQQTAYGEGKKRIVLWKCPYYAKWTGVLQRCFSEKFRYKHPHYLKCSMCKEWLYFSNFKAWMQEQDWEGKVLDKDLLVRGNTEYGPDTCLFVTAEVNNFITENQFNNNDLPPGVHYDQKYGKYVAQCQSGGKTKRYLGRYLTAEEAHSAWLQAKREIVLELIPEIDDLKVIQALKDRYGL